MSDDVLVQVSSPDGFRLAAEIETVCSVQTFADGCAEPVSAGGTTVTIEATVD